MNTPAIVILVLVAAAFVALAIWFFAFGRSLQWPEGKRYKRQTSGKTKVTVVIGPGTDLSKGASELFADACQLAIDSCFKIWNEYRPHDKAEESFKQFGVELVSDEEMDHRSRVFWGQKPDGTPAQPGINGYMWTVKPDRWGEEIPLAVVRGSFYRLVITKGKPVIHETVHALLGEFSKAGVNRDHSHEAFDKVWLPAEALYADRFSASS